MKVRGDEEIVLKCRGGVFPDAEEVNLAANLLAPPAVIVRGERKRGVRPGGLPPPPGSGSWHKRERAPYRNSGSWVRQRECNPASGCRQRFSGSAAAFQAASVGPCLCITCLSAERWLSGRKRRFAKPLGGVNLPPGFESRPLRQILRSKIWRDLVKNSFRIFDWSASLGLWRLAQLCSRLAANEPNPTRTCENALGQSRAASRAGPSPARRCRGRGPPSPCSPGCS